MYITAYAMFRTVECHEIHVRCFVQNIDGGFHVIIYSRRIGNQSHTFTFQAFEVLFFQHFDAGLYFIFCAYATQQRVQRIQRTRCFS